MIFKANDKSPKVLKPREEAFDLPLPLVATQGAHRTADGQPRTREGRMTGNRVKTWTGDEKSLVTVRRKGARMVHFQTIGVSGGLWGSLLAVSMARSVEMAAPLGHHRQGGVQEHRL
jgi:hypothetical protein